MFKKKWREKKSWNFYLLVALDRLSSKNVRIQLLLTMIVCDKHCGGIHETSCIGWALWPLPFKFLVLHELKKRRPQFSFIYSETICCLTVSITVEAGEVDVIVHRREQRLLFPWSHYLIHYRSITASVFGPAEVLRAGSWNGLSEEKRMFHIYLLTTNAIITITFLALHNQSLLLLKCRTRRVSYPLSESNVAQNKTNYSGNDSDKDAPLRNRLI